MFVSSWVTWSATSHVEDDASPRVVALILSTYDIDLGVCSGQGDDTETQSSQPVTFGRMAGASRALAGLDRSRPFWWQRQACTTSEPTPTSQCARQVQTVAILLTEKRCVAPSIRGTSLAIEIVQEVAARSGWPDLLLLTCGTQVPRADASHSPCDASYGGIWSLGRVLRLEHASMRTQAADVSCAGTGALLTLLSGAAESELAWNSDVCHCLRLRPCCNEDLSHKLVVLAVGEYTLTGGLGGLGLQGATLLAKHGATRTVLASRSGRVVRDGQGLDLQLGTLGPTAAVAICDGVDAHDTAGLFSDHGTATGVLHAAGVLRDKMVQAMVCDDLTFAFAPKAIAASHLHRAVVRVPLECMVHFSSIAAKMGNYGQANYAAANGYLDTTAQTARLGGSVASSLQIPAVSGAGMGAFALSAEQLSVMGAITLDVFKLVLSSTLVPVRAAAESIQTMLTYSMLKAIATYMQSSMMTYLMTPILADLHHLLGVPELDCAPAPCEVCEGAPFSKSSSELAKVLMPLAPAEQRVYVEERVLRVVRELTGTPATALGADVPLMQAGVDSLATTELSSRLRMLTGVPISPTLVFEYPTPRAVATHLLHQVADVVSVSLPVAVVVPSCCADSGDQPLALVSAVGQWAGGCDDKLARARLQAACGDGLGTVPAVRWTLDRTADVHTLSAAQQRCVQHGGWLRGAEQFDSRLFGISPAEAKAMDPQQRLLAEFGYSSLHGSSHRRGSLSGGDGGVFLGIERPDWAIAQPRSARESVYAVTGDNVSAAAGRLSFMLGMQGPCLSADTACASALSALHGASYAVRGNECAFALTLAVSLKLAPYATLGAASAGMLSMDGRCKTFDAHANGYARTEGIGALLAMLADEVTLRVTVSSSSVRQDGRSASLTAPNGSAQRALIVATLWRASLLAAEVDCTEAHGTGTALGDPTEAGAIAAVYGGSDTRTTPLLIGAAKASIGHSEAGSGQVGLLKLSRLLQDETASGNAQLRALNPMVSERLDGVSGRFGLPNQAVVARASTRGGVSSFGYSGTIAHSLLRCASSSVSTYIEQHPAPVYAKLSFPWVDAMHPFVSQQRGLSSGPGSTCIASCNFFEIVSDHVVQGRVIFPGAGYLEAARAAKFGTTPSNGDHLREIVFLQPLAVDASGANLQCMIMGERFDIRSFNGTDSVDGKVHCSGMLSHDNDLCLVDLAAIRGAKCLQTLEADVFYETFDAAGLQYGPRYRTLEQLWCDRHHMATARLKIRGHQEGTLVHPADLDDAQCLTLAAHARFDSEPRLPFAVSRAQLQEPSGRLWAAAVQELGSNAMSVLLSPVSSPHSTQLLGFASRLLRVKGAQKERHWLYEMDWSAKFSISSTCKPVGGLTLLSGVDLRPLDSSIDAVELDERKWDQIIFTLALLQTRDSQQEDLWVIDAALRLLQAHTILPTPSPLWVCTFVTQPVSQRSCSAHAGLWGLARACRQELTTSPVWCVDIHHSSPGFDGIVSIIQRLGAEIQLPGGGVQGLHYILSTEPESAFTDMLHTPRLVTSHGVQSSMCHSAFSSIRLALDAHVWQATAKLDMSRLLTAYEDLDILCNQYICTALKWLCDSQVPCWHHKLLFSWCARQPCPTSDVLVNPEVIIGLHPDLWAEVQLAKRCGPALGDAMRGEVAYQEILFPGGSMEAVRPVYEDAVFGSFCNSCVVAAVKAIGELLSSQRGLSVLEIGAGTGGTASSVLPVIRSFCVRYVFTDVSDVFLRQARARFMEYEFLEYALLNIDSDPSLQGRAYKHYELLLSTNCLHATPFMRNTLQNCWKLLKLGGLLVVNEALQTTPFLQITFGLTDGWWLFSEVGDPERIGQDSPLLSWRQWQSLLSHSRFGNITCMQGGGFLTKAGVIVAQSGTHMNETTSSAAHGSTNLISGGFGGLGLLTARLLIQGGAEHIVLSSRSNRVVSGSEDDWTWLVPYKNAVHIVRCNISDCADVLQMLCGLSWRSLHVSGVFHAAHQLSDALLAKQKVMNFCVTYGPKVQGAMTLHAMLHWAMMHAFNVYSSAAGLMGSAGQASHSAANAWLNTMADCRIHQGAVGQSIAWGAVAEIGYAARSGADKRADTFGSGAISRPMAISALNIILLGCCRNFAVLPADWPKLLAASNNARGYLMPYINLRDRPKCQVKAAAANCKMRFAPHVSVGGMSIDKVLQIIQNTAGQEVNIDYPLKEAGIDSLGAVELRNQLQSAVVGCTVLPSTIAFDHPTARLLVEELVPHGAEPMARTGTSTMVMSLDKVLQIVKLTAGGITDADMPLMDSGIDSLGAVELRNQFHSVLGSSIALPSTVVFDHPTARSLSAMFVKDDPRVAANFEDRVLLTRSCNGAMIACIEPSLPGGAHGSQMAWRLAASGSNACTQSPALRWSTDPIRYGAFMVGIEFLDNAAFGVSESEARTMDPQQRVLLEQTYKTLHGAGLPRHAILESDTGVFVGVMSTEFRDVLCHANVYSMTGTGHCFVAGRISYVFGLHGICEAIDVACSASLVACHNARRALQVDAPNTLFAGVNMMLLPAVVDSYVKAGLVSPAGKARVFDSSADGFVRGEACGSGIFCESSPRANNTGPLVAGSAVRQDGRSASLTAPSGKAQRHLLKGTLDDAGSVPSELQLAETAANGSPMGDPIEIGAFVKSIFERRAESGALLTGSVKVNQCGFVPTCSLMS